MLIIAIFEINLCQCIIATEEDQRSIYKLLAMISIGISAMPRMSINDNKFIDHYTIRSGTEL
jgi:hypothetical protein